MPETPETPLRILRVSDSRPSIENLKRTQGRYTFYLELSREATPGESQVFGGMKRRLTERSGFMDMSGRTLSVPDVTMDELRDCKDVLQALLAEVERRALDLAQQQREEEERLRKFADELDFG